jgi:hypothetical protein
MPATVLMKFAADAIIAAGYENKNIALHGVSYTLLARMPVWW